MIKMLKLAVKNDEVDKDKLLIIACVLTKRLKIENYVGATALMGGCGYTDDGQAGGACRTGARGNNSDTHR